MDVIVDFKPLGVKMRGTYRHPSGDVLFWDLTPKDGRNDPITRLTLNNNSRTILFIGDQISVSEIEYILNFYHGPNSVTYSDDNYHGIFVQSFLALLHFLENSNVPREHFDDYLRSHNDLNLDRLKMVLAKFPKDSPRTIVSYVITHKEYDEKIFNLMAFACSCSGELKDKTFDPKKKYVASQSSADFLDSGYSKTFQFNGDFSQFKGFREFQIKCLFRVPYYLKDVEPVKRFYLHGVKKITSDIYSKWTESIIDSVTVYSFPDFAKNYFDSKVSPEGFPNLSFALFKRCILTHPGIDPKEVAHSPYIILAFYAAIDILGPGVFEKVLEALWQSRKVLPAVKFFEVLEKVSRADSLVDMPNNLLITLVDLD